MYFDIQGANTRVFGSLHAVPFSTVDFPARVGDAYRWATTFEIEHDSAELELHGFESDGLTLKPWMQLFQFIRQAFAAGGPFGMGIEAIFSEALRQQGRPPVSHIETGRSFVDRLERVPPADLQELRQAMESHPADMQREVADMYEAWATCDLARLTALQSASAIWKKPTVRDAMFLERNQAWADTIIKRPPRQAPHLLVVGCLHLVGPGNLIDCLRSGGAVIAPMVNQRPR